MKTGAHYAKKGSLVGVRPLVHQKVKLGLIQPTLATLTRHMLTHDPERIGKRNRKQSEFISIQFPKSDGATKSDD